MNYSLKRGYSIVLQHSISALERLPEALEHVSNENECGDEFSAGIASSVRTSTSVDVEDSGSSGFLI